VTKENRKINLRIELSRADEALRAAEALLGLELHADSVSRTYYAVFHFVRALLMSRGVEAKTHSGLIHLFNTELVRSGAFPSSHNRLLGGLQRARELADYDAAVKFSADDARAEITDAKAFAATARDFLKREGWLDEGPG
jgi:uncharacterized protein (UPF0332 family)